MKFVAIVIVLGLGCFIASGLHAEIYSWTDEKGVRHYSHIPPADQSLQVKADLEIPENPADIRQPEMIYEENVNTLLEELDRETGASPAAGSSSRQQPSRQERIQNEMKKLEENLAYLESLPPNAFANSRSRDVIIGKYRYRLQQLKSDPDGYFEQYGF
jgi:Domain of unknown function (DUF4124)